jgi:hypothetical protein
MKKNRRKIFAAIIILITVFFPNFKTVKAAIYDTLIKNNINPISNMNQIFTDLGIDKNELKYNIQTFNTSRTKKQQPQVSISFYPEDPKPGQKVTATATPVYFLNDAKDNYFTWYLKLKGCDEKDGNLSEWEKIHCDDNRDDVIDQEDWKVKASRIIANGGFEWANEKGWPNSELYGSNTDQGSSYLAIPGGNDQGGKNPYCFYHDVNSGNEYRLNDCNHLFPDAVGKYIDTNGSYQSITQHTGDKSFGLDEEKFWHTDPHNSDTAGTSNGDEANVSGLGVKQLSWTYSADDKVGVVVEGISLEPTQVKPYDSSYKIMWAFVKNSCNLSIDSPESKYNKTETSLSDAQDIGIGITCPDGLNQKKKVLTTTTSTVISHIENSVYVRHATYYQDIIDSDCNGIFDEAPGSASATTTTCEDPYTTCYPYDNATPPQTCPCTGSDELKEGTDSLSSGTPTKVKDFNKCLKNNLVDPKEDGPLKKMEINLSYSPEFPMNDDPGHGNAYNKNGDGDNLIVQSSITNANNGAYLKYNWQLYESEDPNPPFWTNITSERLPDDLKTSGFGLDSLKMRLNIPSLENTNFKYLKVKLTVSEDATGTSITRKSSADIVIPISKISDKIQAYNTIVSSDVLPKLSKGSTERCTHKVDGRDVPDDICQVAKDEIVALSVNTEGLTDFLWTVNNQPLQQPNSQEPYGKTAFFPALEDNGFRYTVELSATNTDGDKINLVKTFEVADPEIQIASANEYVCKPNLLGHYIDLDGIYWPDYSKTNFSAISDTYIKLKANFSGFVPTQSQYVWYVDGYEVTPSNASIYGYSIDSDGVLTLTDKPIGSTYDVTAGYLFSQDKNTKKALTQYWGVTMDKFYEKKISSTININFVGSISETQGANKNNVSKKIIASIYSSTPAYIAFLLRIVLTAFALLIFSKIILSFLPNLNKNEY